MSLVSLSLLFILVGCTKENNNLEDKKEKVIEKSNEILPKEEAGIVNEVVNEDDMTEEDLDELMDAMSGFEDSVEAHDTEAKKNQ